MKSTTIILFILLISSLLITSCSGERTIPTIKQSSATQKTGGHISLKIKHLETNNSSQEKNETLSSNQTK